MNTKNNSSFRNNQSIIRESFFALLKEKGIKSTITVSDICRKANINRSTFYRHYLDVRDMSEKICGDLQTPCFQKTKGFEEFILSFLTVIDENRLFFRYYLLNHPNQFDNPQFDKLWENSIVPVFLKHGVFHEEDMKYYFSFFTGGFISVLSNWINGGFKEDKQDIYTILKRCVDSSSRMFGLN